MTSGATHLSADDDFTQDVRVFRAQARARARTRVRQPFDGVIHDEVVAGTQVRRYVPRRLTSPTRVFFLHGGYGVFGDLDIQDGWCRTLAAAWQCLLTSVDYPLTPEHSLQESVDAVLAVIAQHDPSHVLLCGDSAGAALALATASMATATECICALMLTNPNVDLTLSRFDHAAEAGPDAELSRAAFAAWTHGWTHSCDFVASADTLPPVFVAVGRRDALLPEARDLTAALAAAGQRVELAEYDTGHGLVGDAAISDDVLARARRFFEL